MVVVEDARPVAGAQGASAPRRRRPAWARALLATVALLAAAEGAVRLGEDHLPPGGGWISAEYAEKRDRMDALGDAGGVGVALVGSSVVDVSVDPAGLSAAATGGRGAYNAGLIAATPVITETWARELVVPELRPDVVVVAISSRDLNGNGAGMRVQDERFASSLGGAWLRGDLSLADEVEWWLHERSALLRHREALRRPLEALAGYDGPDRNPIRLTDLGLETHLLDERFRDDEAVVDFFRAEPLRDFDVTDDQLGAFRRLVTALEQAGVRVVVLDVPTTAAYVELHPRGAADVARYHAAVDAVAAEAGAEVLRPGTWPDELFSDPLHLGGSGVERLTAELDAYLRTAPRR